MNFYARILSLCLLLPAPLAWSANHTAELEAYIENLKPYFVNEKADLGQYDKVLVDNLKVGYAKVIAPPWYKDEDKGVRKWQLTERDITFLRSAYIDAMTSALQADDGYEVVTEGGPGVIVLDMEIVSLMPYARKNENVQTRGFGKLRAQATLRDGVSGELLAIFEGTQEVGSEYQQNTRLNAENDMRALFEVWGVRMRRVMDDSRE